MDKDNTTYYCNFDNLLKLFDHSLICFIDQTLQNTETNASVSQQKNMTYIIIDLPYSYSN